MDDWALGESLTAIFGCHGGTLAEQFDVVCLGGAVGEAIAVGLQGSGLTLAVVKREPPAASARIGVSYHATVERRQLNQRSRSRTANPLLAQPRDIPARCTPEETTASC